MTDTIRCFYPWPIKGTTYSRVCRPTWPLKRFTKKAQRELFKSYAQSVADNLAGHPGALGYVLDFDGGLYEISRERKSARRLAENAGAEVREHFKSIAS